MSTARRVLFELAAIPATVAIVGGVVATVAFLVVKGFLAELKEGHHE